MIRVRRTTAVLAIALCLACLALTVACDQNDYHKATQAAAGVSSGLQAMESETETLFHSGVLDKEEAIGIVRAIESATRVNDQYVAQLRVSGKLDTDTKQVVMTWLNGMTDSVDTLNEQRVLHIKNLDSRAKLTAYVVSVRSSLQIVTTIMQSSGGAR